MEERHSPRTAALGILLTWCLYIAFAFSTDWEDYGLVPTWPVDYLRYTVARLSTVFFWLSVAALLLFLRHRNHPVNWRSFSYAFVATGVTSLILIRGINSGADFAAIAGAVLCYASISGFLSVTVSTPRIAAALSLLLFALQFLGDALVQLFTGVFRFT